MLDLGHKLKLLRKINNLSAEEVAYLLKTNFNMIFSPTSIYKWEENIVEPNINTIIALSHIYNSSISYLLCEPSFETSSLTKQESKILDMFRTDKTFMRIALLGLKYFTA